ncbi:MAG TPA: DoxX family protein [Acidiferrobacter sp.]|nr:DoxX family protein [Acidiferrobacter sp.]
MADNKKGLAVFDLIARILLALIFVFAALGKIADYHGTAMYMAAYGIPVSLLPLVIAVELLGGLAVIIGLWTRFAAWMLAAFSIVAIVIFHHTFATMSEQIIGLAEISFTGGLIGLAVNGPRCISVDAWMKKRSS